MTLPYRSGLLAIFKFQFVGMFGLKKQGLCVPAFWY